MISTGGCLCGAIRYAASGAPSGTSLCHCDSCRRACGGTALAWAIFPEAAVTITQGTLAIYESTPGVERGFCGRCGTSLTYARANRPGLFDVTTASLDDPDRLPPDKEIWTAERLAFVAPNPALPQYAGFSTPPAEADA